MDNPVNPSIDDQIACVKRELRMRERVYAKNLTPERAREKILMAAVLKTLEKIRDDELKHRFPQLEF